MTHPPPFRHTPCPSPCPVLTFGARRPPHVHLPPTFPRAGFFPIHKEDMCRAGFDRIFYIIIPSSTPLPISTQAVLFFPPSSYVLRPSKPQPRGRTRARAKLTHYVMCWPWLWSLHPVRWSGGQTHVLRAFCICSLTSGRLRAQERSQGKAACACLRGLKDGRTYSRRINSNSTFLLTGC